MIIPVDLGSRSYSIVVEPGALAGVGARLRELHRCRHPQAARRCRHHGPRGRRSVGHGARGARRRGGQDAGRGRALLGSAARRGRRSHVDPVGARRRRGGRSRGLRGGDVHAGREFRPAADDRARSGRRLHRRQDRDRPSQGQEPHRRVLPAASGRRRSRRRLDAARARLPLGPRRDRQARRGARCRVFRRRGALGASAVSTRPADADADHRRLVSAQGRCDPA